MKKLVRRLLEAVLDRMSDSKRSYRYRHADEERYGWKSRNRDRFYKQRRYGHDRYGRKPHKSLLYKIRKAF